MSIKLQENHPEVATPISDWKGDEIALLREDLQSNSGGTLSEKWFYTHVKNNQNKLPRVDTLNLLSHYVGAGSWKGFLHVHGSDAGEESIEYNAEPLNKEGSNTKLRYLVPVVILCLVPLMIYLFSTRNDEVTQYKICFLDKNTHMPVIDSFLEIKVIKPDETPLFYPLQNNCFQGEGGQINFVVKGRFYKPMHIKRTIKNSHYEESIYLEPDDYSMILHLFANSKVEDWKKRRNQLIEMMHEHLKAYEISSDGFTIDVLNREDFVNKMTLPTRVLKEVSIVETIYEGDKIAQIKFTQE